VTSSSSPTRPGSTAAEVARPPEAPPVGGGLASARVALLAQTLLSAGTYLVTKHAVGTPQAPGALAAREILVLRFLIAIVALLGLVAIAPKRFRIPRRRWGTVVLLGFLGVPVNVGCFFEGLARAPAAHAALCYALTPVFVFLLERLRGGDRLTAARVAGLSLALAGVLVILIRPGSLSGPEPAGDLLLLAAAVAWALYTVLSRPLVAEVGSHASMVLSLLAGGLMLLPIAPWALRDTDLHAIPLPVWGDVLYVAIFTTIVAYSLWLFALKRLDATQVAVFMNLQPIATAALAWLLLGEPITSGLVAATLLVIGGVTLVQRSRAGR